MKKKTIKNLAEASRELCDTLDEIMGVKKHGDACRICLKVRAVRKVLYEVDFENRQEE